MKGTAYLNPDPFCHFIGPRNWGEALIDDKLTTCLLDNGSQLNFVTPTYARERGMDILSLDTLAWEIGGQLPPIAIMGGGMIKPEGFVIMNVQVPCVKGYNEDQIAIVMEDPEMKAWPVVLGMPTLFRVMEVIKESEISELAVPWANSRLSWLMRGVHAKMSQLQVKDVANKPIAPLSVDEVVRVTSKCMVPPFGHKVIHGRVGLFLQGYKMNVMTHGLEKRSPLLPLGLEVQSAYATLATGSGRVPVVFRTNTKGLAGDQERHTYSQDGGRKLGPPGHQRHLSQGTRSRLHLNRGGASGPAPGQVGLVRPRGVADRTSGKGSWPPEGVPRYLFP